MVIFNEPHAYISRKHYDKNLMYRLEMTMLSPPMDMGNQYPRLDHSPDHKHYKIASKLAAEAASVENLRDHYQVQWLKKASYDRYRISIGKSGIYNTQDKISISFE
ncbi:hypothetical protein EL17_20980 [Anditalea andensis]|uniref:Uncharacterized protein n=1 Tax=Anditalea andensis TaxID=1048983 RepID=A0A074KSU1_9BACT|nr:hypothetical protein EL17_20980 [Anditalea andensis]